MYVVESKFEKYTYNIYNVLVDSESNYFIKTTKYLNCYQLLHSGIASVPLKHCFGVIGYHSLMENEYFREGFKGEKNKK